MNTETVLRDHPDYARRALMILATYQLVELNLKIHIGAAYKVIASKVGDVVPFKYDGKDIENFPLERLIGIFKKVNDNSDLHKMLDRLRDHRNELAHKGLLYNFPSVREMLSVDIDEKSIRLEEAENELAECLALLIAEVNSLAATMRRILDKPEDKKT